MFTSNVRNAALPALLTGILAAGIVLDHCGPRGNAAPAPPPPKVPKKLLEERRDAAKRVYEQKWVRYKYGFGSVETLLGWSERWLESDLALQEKKPEQIKLLQAHLDRTRELERTAIAYAKTAAGTQSDADAATYERINAEVRIFKATGKIPPPPANVKPIEAPQRIKEAGNDKELPAGTAPGKRRTGREKKLPLRPERNEDAKKAPPKNGKELLRQRFEAAQRTYEEKFRDCRRGAASPSDFFGWSERLLEAELALSNKADDRLAALKAHLKRTRETELFAISYVESGLAPRADADAATYERINADIRYFQATGKVPPPPPKLDPKLRFPREDLGSPVEEKKIKR